MVSQQGGFKLTPGWSPVPGWPRAIMGLSRALRGHKETPRHLAVGGVSLKVRASIPKSGLLAALRCGDFAGRGLHPLGAVQCTGKDADRVGVVLIRQHIGAVNDLHHLSIEVEGGRR